MYRKIRKGYQLVGEIADQAQLESDEFLVAAVDAEASGNSELAEEFFQKANLAATRAEAVFFSANEGLGHLSRQR